MRVRKQEGLTLIGFIIVLAMTIFVAYVGMKIGPMYADYFAVDRSMKEVANKKGAARMPPNQIRLDFFTLMNMNSIDFLKGSDLKYVRGNPSKIAVKFESRKNVIGNLDVVVTFDKTMPLSE
jgi:hypothetical protein